MSKQVHHAISDKTVMVIIGGRPRMHNLDTEQGKKLVEALRKPSHDIEEITKLADVPTFIAAQSFGRVTIDDRDQLRLDGVVVDYGMTDVIIRIFREGGDVTSLTNFLSNVAENPNKDIANDLYEFISKGLLPITPEGHFLAFKRVASNFFDLHSGTVDYSLGKKPSMDRALCDANRNKTCSTGLHACSYDYLPNFHAYNSGTHIMIVKINPRDVTAIPPDYNLTKLRCCLMEVVDEVPDAEAQAHFKRGVDTRYSPVKEDVEPSDDATAADGVHDASEDDEDDFQNEYEAEDEQAANESMSIEFARELAADDGEETAQYCSDIFDDMTAGDNYEAVVTHAGFDITYPIHFVKSYLEVYDLPKYHSEQAYAEGVSDAELAFTMAANVEQSFDFTTGQNFGNIPFEAEEAYGIGFLTKMLDLQINANPDA